MMELPVASERSIGPGTVLRSKEKDFLSQKPGVESES